MKIKTKALSYDELAAQPAPAHRNPRRPSLFFRTLVRLAAAPDLRDAQFTFTKERMEGFEESRWKRGIGGGVGEIVGA